VIVHGDPGREEPLGAMIEALRRDVARVLASVEEAGGVDCDALRRILVRAGELEQAVFDRPSSAGSRGTERRLRALRAATSLAASAFHDACDVPRGGGAAVARVRASLARMLSALGRLAPEARDGGRVWVRMPGGFAIDALLPEQYREAAILWAGEHAGIGEDPVLVVGIRSIGTSLSAIVTATLRSRGVHARRITVRPKGGPLKRTLRLAPILPASYGLIVDEGPGASGSSILAVADALQRAGVERIHVFPGHARGLGARASEEARARWNSLPSFFAPAREARVASRPLAEELWRSVDPEDRDPLRAMIPRRGAPRTAPALIGEGSSGRRVVFTFAGFATAPGTSLSLAEVRIQKIARLAGRGLTPAPLGTAHGFIATDWIDGCPLDRADASPELMGWIGGYVAAAAGPPLSAAAARAARNRVETMISVNAAEALGDSAAAMALSLFRPVAVLENMPRSGDGRLAPRKWIRTPDGRVLKTDAGGHEVDPTWTGRQPVLWDLAGAILEWDLGPALERDLLDGFARAGGYCCAPLALDAYRAAYAAHRVGQVSLARDAETDREERERLSGEYERWREKLAGCLGPITAPS
jgi:hypothetical protein